MTITLSDIAVVATPFVRKEKRARTLRNVRGEEGGSTISAHLESIRAFEPSAPVNTANNVRELLGRGTDALSTFLACSGDDSIVIKCAFIRETDGAFLIHSVGSENIIIAPKSFPIPAIVGSNGTPSLEIIGLRCLCESYFIATTFRVLSN